MDIIHFIDFGGNSHLGISEFGVITFGNFEINNIRMEYWTLFWNFVNYFYPCNGLDYWLPIQPKWKIVHCAITGSPPEAFPCSWMMASRHFEGHGQIRN
jgi:hypothetical protein